MLERVVFPEGAVWQAYQRYIAKLAAAIVENRWEWVENLATALIEQRRLRGHLPITTAAFGERFAKQMLAIERRSGQRHDPSNHAAGVIAGRFDELALGADLIQHDVKLGRVLVFRLDQLSDCTESHRDPTEERC